MPFIEFGKLSGILRERPLTSWNKIASGRVETSELILSSAGFMRSENYTPGSVSVPPMVGDTPGSGWAVFGSGDAHFYGDVFLGELDVIGDITVFGGDLRLRNVTFGAQEISSEQHLTITTDYFYLDHAGGEYLSILSYNPGGIGQGDGVSITAAGEFTIATTSGGDGDGQVLFDDISSGVDGSASLPILSFAGDPNTGIFRPAADELAFSAGGTQILDLQTDYIRIGANSTGQLALKVVANGSASTPGYTFQGDADTGLYRNAADNVALAAGGTSVFRSTASNTVLPVAAASTTGSAANAHLNSTSGLLSRSTSSLRYKEGWQFVDMDVLADLTLPTPIVWEAEYDVFLGFGTEHVAAMLPAAVQDDGENYDVRALVAILTAKVRRLEQQVADLLG